MNDPTPKIPFAPRAASDCCGDPWLLHPAGTVEYAGSPITSIGTELACSPPILISAVFTGPQVIPRTNCAHSTTGSPPTPFCCGNDPVKAAESTRIRHD